MKSSSVQKSFREKFCSARPETVEFFKSFHTRIVHLYSRWIELSETDKNFDSLMNLILQEQVLKSFSKEMVVFLKERKCQSVEELVEASERECVAHPGKSIARKRVSNLWISSDFEALMSVWLMLLGDITTLTEGIVRKTVEVLRVLLLRELPTVVAATGVRLFLLVIDRNSLVRSRTNSLSSSA